MPLGKANCNGNIWCFINSEFDVTDTEKQLTLCLTKQQHSNSLHVTLVYFKCNVEHRQILGEDIYYMTTTIDGAWLIGRDFNVVLKANGFGGFLFKILIMKSLRHIFRVVIYQSFNSKAALSPHGVEESEMIVFLKDWIRFSLISTNLVL